MHRREEGKIRGERLKLFNPTLARRALATVQSPRLANRGWAQATKDRKISVRVLRKLDNRKASLPRARFHLKQLRRESDFERNRARKSGHSFPGSGRRRTGALRLPTRSPASVSDKDSEFEARFAASRNQRFISAGRIPATRPAAPSGWARRAVLRRRPGGGGRCH